MVTSNKDAAKIWKMIEDVRSSDNTPGRGPNDLEERIEHLKKQKVILQDTIDGYKMLIEEQKKEIWQLKQIRAENEKNKNLVEGYKRVIEDLSKNVR